jgi:hypothetical protein
MYVIYDEVAKGYLGANDTTVQDVKQALKFFSKSDIRDHIEYDDDLIEKDENFDLNCIAVHECKGCDTVDCESRADAYGIFTGYWCQTCYDGSKYPYKKHRYDYAAYGESLD